MSAIRTLQPESTARHIAGTVDALADVARDWARDVQAHLVAASSPTSATLDPFVLDLVSPALREHDGLVTGAGFVAAPGLLRDARWHLAWWLRRGEGMTRLATVEDPTSEQFRDYTTLEWWRFPARSGAGHLTGPYVDYVCTDDYTVTFTTPVHVDGVLAGVTGVDTLVDHLERTLLPAMREVGHECTLVNPAGRVVTSTLMRREPGSIFRADGLAEALTPLREEPHAPIDVTLPSGARVISCGDTALALVIGV